MVALGGKCVAEIKIPLKSAYLQQSNFLSLNWGNNQLAQIEEEEELLIHWGECSEHSPSPSFRSWVSVNRVTGGVLWAGSVLQKHLACLASFPFRELLWGRGTKAVSAVGPAISCWKMLLPFKKRMVRLPRRTRHLEMGDASSAQLGLVSADKARALCANTKNSVSCISLPSCFARCRSALPICSFSHASSFVRRQTSGWSNPGLTKAANTAPLAFYL